MKTVILSDLHLGPGGPYEIFTGEHALVAALTNAAPERVVLNGDTFDLLMNDAPLAFDPAGAAAQLRAITEGPAFLALRRALQGREVIVRPGNHDLELHLPEVQRALQEALPGVLINTDETQVLQIGAARIALTHGEQDDDWNRYAPRDLGPGFAWPPGSILVKEVLNPAKVQRGLAFADLLKPDVGGALLAALAVDPGALSLLRAPRVREMLARWVRRRSGQPLAFEADAPSVTLEPEDAEALLALLGPQALLPELRGHLDRAGARILRAALSQYAWAWRLGAGPAGRTFQALEPDVDDWATARRVAAADVDAVVAGHTHAARLGHRAGLTVVNTGTWAKLMMLPPRDASAREWDRMLHLLREDPALERQARDLVVARRTGAEIPADGAEISLVEWDATGREVERHTRALTRRPLAMALMPGAPAQPAIADLAPRFQRLEDELDRHAHRDPRRMGDLLTPTLHRDLLAAEARGLLASARARLAQGAVAQAIDELGRAEATWTVYGHLDAQRRGDLGLEIEWAEGVVIDGYGTAMEAALDAGFAIPEAGRPPLPLVVMEPGARPATWTRGRDAPSPTWVPRIVHLPFPVVLIPPDWLWTPSLLVLAHHEVGHDLDIDLGLAPPLSDALAAAQRATGALKLPWAHWLAEILADLIGLHLGGTSFVAASERVLAPLLPGNGGWTSGPHPPISIRMALLELAMGDTASAAARLRGDPLAARHADEVQRALDVLLSSPLPAIGGRRLPELLPPIVANPGGWRGLPASAAAAAPGDERVRFASLARTLHRRPWQLGARQRTFLASRVPRMAATFADPTTLFKAPPVSLLLDFDESFFVGATNGQLRQAMETAHGLRGGRPWRRIELYFLDDDGLRAIASEHRPASLLIDERDHAQAGLAKALSGWALDWSIYRYSGPFQFLSLWRRDDLRRVHASAHLWGAELRNAPAMDWQAVGQEPHPEVDAYFQALDALRGQALRVTGGGAAHQR